MLITVVLLDRQQKDDRERAFFCNVVARRPSTRRSLSAGLPLEFLYKKNTKSG